MEDSEENVHVDIGTERVKSLILLQPVAMCALVLDI